MFTDRLKSLVLKILVMVTDGHTDGRTDIRTDIRTDTPSYRDATAHLKTSQTMLIQFLAAPKQIELQKRAWSHLKAFEKNLSDETKLVLFRRSFRLIQLSL